MVRGSYFLEGDSIRLQAQITDAKSLTDLESVEAVWSLEDRMEGVDALRGQVMGALAAHLEPRLGEWRGTARPRWSGQDTTTTSLSS